MNIRGNKVLLRAIEFEDMEFLRNMLNDEEMVEFSGFKI